MSVMLQCYSVTIYQGIHAPGNGKEGVDELNAIYKVYIYQLMSYVQPPGSKLFDFQMQMHTSNQKNDVIISK